LADDGDLVDRLVGQLTLTEKCRMVAGQDTWSVPGCDRLGIPDWRVSDGPVGVRGRTDSTPGLVLPGPSAMAATWDVELVETLGVALAAECDDRDVDVLLAPTVNLHRSPRGGRHFECFSEDPELSARMAVAYITGVQSQGVAACVKHFVANDQEHERLTIDARIDERTLREVYLRPFEAAVTEAGVRSVMASYNFVNGEHACSQAELLQGVLKGEWGFDGMVMSDWRAMKETLAPARNGLDVEMPGPGKWWGEGRLEAAVAAGDVDEAVVDDKVRRILGLLAWRGRLPGRTTTGDERSVDRPEHGVLARRAATESMVLMRNDGLLPLAPGASVALIGPGAASTALLGGGSAALQTHRHSSVLDALTERWSGDVTHVEGASLNRGAPSVPKEWIGDGGVIAELYSGVAFDGEPIQVQQRSRAFNWWHGERFPTGVDDLSVRLRFTMTPDASGRYRLVGCGFWEARLFIDGELVTDTTVEKFPTGMWMRGADAERELEAGRPYDVLLEALPEAGGESVALTDVGIELVPTDPDARFAEAEQAAAEADIAVVVVGSNSDWESEGADRGGIELPVRQDELVRRVAAANPRTVVVLNCGAPMLLPWLDDVPAVLLAWYPGQEAGDAIVDVLIGDAEPAGRMPTTWARAERDTPSFLHYPGEAGVVRYGEELHVGHRWYDARAIDPLVPFGHGGSYTTFEWGQPTLTGQGTEIVVEVPLANVGDRAGSDVVQVYVARQRPPVLRPPKELAGFAKVRLDSGKRTTARVALRPRSFARWDVASHAWTIDPGTYDIVVAASAVDIRYRLPHVISE
jgi:beta-glucosidase